MDQMVIYKSGDMGLRTTVTNGYCDFSGVHREDGKDFTVEEYLEFLGLGYKCLPIDNAIEEITQIENDVLIKPWEEITLDQWDYWLEVLPPEKWTTVNGVNLFGLTEYYKGTITRHCARVDNRCFSALRRITTGYMILAEEIKRIL